MQQCMSFIQCDSVGRKTILQEGMPKYQLLMCTIPMIEKLMLAMVMQKFACCRKALVVVPRMAFDFRAATNVKIAAGMKRPPGNIGKRKYERSFIS
uniref:Uncharacterized protein n=1 Tax=Romanomermis culicivorax TaxID=13658 RepID=A0A915IEX7_ROMCU